VLVWTASHMPVILSTHGEFDQDRYSCRGIQVDEGISTRCHAHRPGGFREGGSVDCRLTSLRTIEPTPPEISPANSAALPTRQP